jgi:hypothetical protein
VSLDTFTIVMAKPAGSRKINIAQPESKVDATGRGRPTSLDKL